ncbi:HAD-IIA family hydrolase [Alicyclobacillus sp. ALC3]|uniref:HAD-IIA family hydrolase n=1 Tax=Alicyclobacillus sp. ALC3 TaxID=2796143 RepID=UPI002379E4F1|nr:HAD-IIA family hydrolase [Alicyclobacillus sp. ALC3]WDL96863.1 HAD-IIA family hydrolase [Alicyclobacillus sp. ALC3]
MLENVRVALLDIDGTLCRGASAIAGAAEFVERIRDRKIRPVFFTNNATRTPEQVVSYLASCGIGAHIDEVCTSAQFAAHIIAKRVGERAKVAYIGQSGLEQALSEQGCVLVRPPSKPELGGDRGVRHAAEAAVMGLDPTATYATLAWFCHQVVGIGWYMLTNNDARFPSDDGFVPGNGALGSFVTTATGIKPVVAGKPNPDFVRYTLERFSAEVDEAVVIGDNGATDIRAGLAAGVLTIQVRSGVPLPTEGSEADFVVDSVADL